MKEVMSAFILLAVVTIASAIPIGRTTICKLLEQSSVVLKGTVVEVRETAISRPLWSFSMPGHKSMMAIVEPSYVLKGAPPRVPVEVLFPYISSDAPFVALREGYTYIFFLATDGSLLKVADLISGAIPVISGPKPEHVSDIEGLIKSEFEKSLASSEPSVIMNALVALSEVGDTLSLENVNPLTNSTNESIRATACATAVALGNWRKASDVVSFLESHMQPSGSITLSNSEKGIDVGMLTRVLNRTTNPDSVPLYLQLLSRTKDPYILIEILSAPCITSSKTATPIVSQFLDSENNDVAYAAYRALMTIKGSAYKAQHVFIKDKYHINTELKSWSISNGEAQ